MGFTIFIAGRVLQHASAAMVLLSIIALANRGRRPGIRVAVEVLAWLVVASGGLVGAAYLWELAELLSGRDLIAQAGFVNRARGSGAASYWAEALSVVVAPQLFWLRRCRASLWLALLIGAGISAPAFFSAANSPGTAWPPAVRAGAAGTGGIAGAERGAAGPAEITVW